MPGRVLHLLSQRPGLTGSGVTLDAMVRLAAGAGWQQAVGVGLPAAAPLPTVGELPPAAVHPVYFGGQTSDLPYPIPGMSDVMPYQSSVWSALTADQLKLYREVWGRHLARLIADFEPDIIHTHHIWLMSSLLKDIAPHCPVVATCHSTGLRQLQLTPHLADEVRRGCARLDHFCVLREDHATDLARELGVAPAQITVVGAGYQPEIFCRPPAAPRQATDILYVGKYSRAKGLPWLLTAFSRLLASYPDARLHLAGSGSGPEADDLRQRVSGLAPQVTPHGQLNQPELAALMGRGGVCVLPSFYEGVPLVLVEAAACGCQLVSTALPGVRERIQPTLGPWLEMVPLPRLCGVDEPEPADLPAFTLALERALATAMAKAATPSQPTPDALAPFTWQAVFARVAAIWQELSA